QRSLEGRGSDCLDKRLGRSLCHGGDVPAAERAVAAHGKEALICVSLQQQIAIRFVPSCRTEQQKQDVAVRARSQCRKSGERKTLCSAERRTSRCEIRGGCHQLCNPSAAWRDSRVAA